MRRGVSFLLLALVAATLGAASAYAAGGASTTTTTTTTPGTTTTPATTTTSTTTTGTTTTTPPPPTYARLTPSYLPAGCIGAGAAAIAEPGRQVLALGTPASARGASAYPSTAPIVRFAYSTASGSGCSTARVALGSVSLFGSAVTAASVAATHGNGVVSGLRIYGTPVALRAGHPVRIGGWGEVTLEKTVGRLTAPIVVQLLTAHQSLPAGTTIALAFGASPQVAQEPGAKMAGNGSRKQAKSAGKTNKRLQQPSKPPPDFPAAASPFAKSGGFTEAAQDNPVVAIAMRYLGIRYQWGGASPATGFDCSGLVQYVFAQFGVPLVHYAAAQWHAPNGVWVPPNRLQSGDLVFFVGSDGTRKEPGHVGIYVDDGYFIDAPHTGSFVRVDSLTEQRFANQYVGARRIVGASVDARHLLDATDSNVSAAAFRVGFQPPFALEPLSGSIGAAAGQVGSSHASEDGGELVGAALGGVLLLSAGGVFIVRRRRASEALPNGNPAD